MKALKFLAGFCLASSLLEPQAACAADWYGSAEVGQSNFGSVRDDGGPFGPQVSSPGTTDSFDGHAAAWRLAAGYRFNPYFGLEGGYTKLGQATDAQTFPGVSPTTPPRPITAGFHDTLKADGFMAEGVGRWPFADAWFLYLRAGLMRSHTELDVVGEPSKYYSSFALSADKTSFTYGMGAGWNLSSRLALHLGWDHYSALGDKVTMTYSVNVLSLGLAYNFK